MCNLVSILKRILVSLTEMSGVANHASFFSMTFHHNRLKTYRRTMWQSITFNFKLMKIILYSITKFFVILNYRLSNLNMNRPHVFTNNVEKERSFLSHLHLLPTLKFSKIVHVFGTFSCFTKRPLRRPLITDLDFTTNLRLNNTQRCEVVAIAAFH